MCLKTVKQLWGMRGPIITFLAVIFLLPLATSGYKSWLSAYVGLVMLLLWMTEAIPIAAVALIPIVMLPACGVLSTRDVSRNYPMAPTVLGCLVLAVAADEWGLHRRIALGMLRIVGFRPPFVMLGLMLPTWFLSMWISNTATASIMFPIANAVMIQLKNCQTAYSRTSQQPRNSNRNISDTSAPEGRGLQNGERGARVNNEGTIQRYAEGISLDVLHTEPETTFNPPPSDQPGVVHNNVDEEDAEVSADTAEFNLLCRGLCLCIAYSCNIGSIATLTGTPPNVVLKALADEVFDQQYIYVHRNVQPGSGITFGNWMGFAVPLSAITLVLAWLILMLRFLIGYISKEIPQKQKQGIKAIIMQEWKQLGPFTMAEIEIAVLHLILLIMLVSRDPWNAPGWSVWFPTRYVQDGSAVMLIVILLFLLPAVVPRVFCLRKSEHEHLPYYRPLVTWEQVHRKLPWEVFILLGGGYAVANACRELLSKRLAEFEEWIRMDTLDWPYLFYICTIFAFTAEVTSSTQVVVAFLPPLAHNALNSGINPLFLMIPATVAASFSFMLPVATPPTLPLLRLG